MQTIADTMFNVPIDITKYDFQFSLTDSCAKFAVPVIVENIITGIENQAFRHQ